MADALPTADDLLASTKSTPQPPDGTPSDPQTPPVATNDNQLPTADDLYNQVNETRFYPTVGRIVRNFADDATQNIAKILVQRNNLQEDLSHPIFQMEKAAASQFYQSAQQMSSAILSTVKPAAEAQKMTGAEPIGTPVADALTAKAKAENRPLTTDEKEQIAAESANIPVAPVTGMIFAPLTPLMPLLDAAFQTAEKEGVTKGHLALLGTAMMYGGLAHAPHEVATESLAAGAHLPEDTFLGLKEPTEAETKVAEVATQQLPEVTPPTVHEFARQVAPEVFNEYDGLSVKREQLGNMMRDLAEKNRQDIEAASPFVQQISDLEDSMAGGSKRQKKIAQAKIDDLQEQHHDWVQQNLQPSEEMENVRQQYNAVDYRMRDMAPDVSAAYRAAQEKIPEPKPQTAVGKIENKELEPVTPVTPEARRGALAKEAETAKGQLKTVLKRAASAKINPDKAIKDISWAQDNERPDIVGVLTDKLEAEANKKAIDTNLPEGIAGHVKDELVKAGRPLEEAAAAARLIEEHYRARSERFGGLKGTPEEMYARDSAIIKAGRNAGVREFAQGKGRLLKQSSLYNSAAARLRDIVKNDIGIRNVDDFIDRAGRGELTGVERRRLPNDAISAARALENAYDKVPAPELYQPGDYGLPGFYSKMYRGLEEKLNNTGTPDQMLKQVDSLVKNGAFKKDELYWSGLEDYLKGLPEQGKKVGKDQILQWLDNNKLEIGEHILDQDSESENSGFTEDDVHYGGLERVDVESEDPHMFDEEVDHYVEMFHEDNGTDAQAYYEKEGEPESDPFLDIEDVEDGKKTVSWNDEAIRDDAAAQARDHFNEYGEQVEEVDIGYGAHTFKIYVDENAGSYRIVDTDNNSDVDSGTARNHLQERAREALWEHLRNFDIAHYSDDEDYNNGTKYSDYQEEGPKEDYQEMLITLPEISDRGVSQHGWPESAKDDNILMHLRFNTRSDAEGKRVLFLEEMQSDWHQQGRSKGYIKSLKEREEMEAAFRAAKDNVDEVLQRRDNLGFDSVAEARNALRQHDDWAQRWDIEGADDIKKVEDYRSAWEADRQAKDGVAAAPFADLNKYTELGMKRIIGFAAEKGYDKIAWTTGDQQAARWSGALQRQVQEIRISPESTPEGIKLQVKRAGGGDVTDFIAKQVRGATYDEDSGYLTMKPEEIRQVFGKGLEDQVLERAQQLRENPPERPSQQDVYDAQKAVEDAIKENNAARDNAVPAEQRVRAQIARDDAIERRDALIKARDKDSVISGLDLKVNDKGMTEVYDKVMVNVANSIIKKFGEKVKLSDIDLGRSKKLEDGTRENSPSKQPSFDLTPELKKSAQEGQTLFQGARGKIRLGTGSARAAITLMKDADASTFIHETGHHWLDELMRDAADPQAPSDLKADAETVRKWLGAEGDISTRQHERFARGFERYLMEGIAPSRGLADVFAKFKDWLTSIYKTVQKLRSPINDDIRHVFDRLLTTKPEKAVISPDSEAGKMMADIHEADARIASPQHAAATADNIERELDKTLNLHSPEIHDEIKAAESNKAPSQPAEAPGAPADIQGKSEPAGGQRDTVATGGGGSEGTGTGEPAANAVNRASTKPPESANAKFEPDTKFIDRAGNIRLDNLSTPDDVNQVIRDAAAENSDFLEARRNVLSDGEVLSLAESLGMDPAMLNRRKIGQAFNAEQVIAARKLLIKSATAVRDAMDKAADGTDQDVMAYAEVRSRHQMIQEQVAGITAEAGRALRAFHAIEGSQDAKALGEFLKTQTGKDLFQLKQEAQLGKTLDSAQKVSKFINDSKKSTVRNMVLEYYINALISGPITHLRYSVGNALNAVWTPLIEIPTAAALGAFRGKGDKVYLGEAGAQLHGLLKGSKDGMYAAAKAFKTGNSPALPGEKFNPMFEDRTNAIPGKIGKVINLPSKSVAAIHSFFKSVRYEQNIQGLAYRTAANEGLVGDAFVNRVADITTNPTEAMMEQATAGALKELYMTPTDYHSAMGALTRFTNQSLLAKIIVPFMKIGSQITRNAFVERTPLGFGSSKIRATMSEGGAGRDFQLAKMATGIALMGTTVLLAAEGKATGDGPNDPEKRRVWLLTHNPNSIQIGGVTIPYQGLGHLGMLMRFSANMFETASEWGQEDDGKLAFSFLEGVNKSVLDENFMRGLKDLLDAVYHPQEYGDNYLKNFATNWLPFSVGLGQVARKIDPYRRETRDILDTAWSKIPLASEGLFPRRDMFGAPIPNGGTIQSYDNDRVVQRMTALQMGVGKVEKKINGVELTPQQYDDYTRISGKLSKQMLNNLITPGFDALPQGEQIKMIKTTIEHARETARNMIKFNPANQNILQQIIANKRALLR